MWNSDLDIVWSPGIFPFLGPTSLYCLNLEILIHWIMYIFQIWHFIMQYFKESHWYHHWYQQKDLYILGICEAHGSGYKFSKILIFAQKLKFYHWQQILSLVFQVTSLLHLFWENVWHLSTSNVSFLENSHSKHFFVFCGSDEQLWLV